MTIPWLTIGKGLLKLWGRRIKRKWKKKASRLVLEAALLHSTGKERRQFVRNKLMTEYGLSESMARRVTEYGVNKWKSLL